MYNNQIHCLLPRICTSTTDGHGQARSLHELLCVYGSRSNAVGPPSDITTVIGGCSHQLHSAFSCQLLRHSNHHESLQPGPSGG